MTDAPEMEEWEIDQSRLYIANLCPSRVRDYVTKIELERIDALAREAKLREALAEVRRDCLERAKFSRDGRTVPIGDSVWEQLCAVLSDQHSTDAEKE